MNKLMMSLTQVGILVVFAMLVGSVAYAAPNEGVCDDLKDFQNGLHGLCQAFCEAQDCVATFDASTGELSFPKNCRSSSAKTLKRYNKRSEEVGGPPMPCVNVEPGGCPCWSEAEIDLVADRIVQTCENPSYYTLLIGFDLATNGQEYVATAISGSELECFYQEWTPALTIRYQELDSMQHEKCSASVIAECLDRFFTMDLESSTVVQFESGTSPTATPTPAPTATPTAAPTPPPAICLESGEWCNAEGSVCCSNDCYAKGNGGNMVCR